MSPFPLINAVSDTGCLRFHPRWISKCLFRPVGHGILNNRGFDEISSVCRDESISPCKWDSSFSKPPDVTDAPVGLKRPDHVLQRTSGRLPRFSSPLKGNVVTSSTICSTRTRYAGPHVGCRDYPSTTGNRTSYLSNSRTTTCRTFKPPFLLWPLDDRFYSPWIHPPDPYLLFPFVRRMVTKGKVGADLISWVNTLPVKVVRWILSYGRGWEWESVQKRLKVFSHQF